MFLNILNDIIKNTFGFNDQMENKNKTKRNIRGYYSSTKKLNEERIKQVQRLSAIASITRKEIYNGNYN